MGHGPSAKDAAAVCRHLRVEPGTKLRLADHDPHDALGFHKPPDAKELLRETTGALAEYQRRLAAQDTDSLLGGLMRVIGTAGCASVRIGSRSWALPPRRPALAAPPPTALLGPYAPRHHP
jgi:hypothetical protein